MIGIVEIRGAVARGWCAPKNSAKVMDTDLAEAIGQEILRLVLSKEAVVWDDTLCAKCGKPFQVAVNGICITCDPSGGGCLGQGPA